MPVETLIGVFKDKPLDFNPGEKWRYNNSGYILLGAILEKVSGKSYERFVEEEVFQKAGMKSSREEEGGRVMEEQGSVAVAGCGPPADPLAVSMGAW